VVVRVVVVVVVVVGVVVVVVVEVVVVVVVGAVSTPYPVWAWYRRYTDPLPRVSPHV
jgi:hypothetical protein